MFSTRVTESGSAVVPELCPPPVRIILRDTLHEPCPICLGDALLASPVNPAGIQLLSPGFEPVGASNLIDSRAASALVDPSFSVALAGDTPWATGPHIGAIIDVVTGTVATGLRAVNGVITPDTTPTDPPAQSRPKPLFVVSARRQQVAFFDQRDGQGNLVQGAKVFDLALSSTSMKPYLGQWQMHAPVAATYRAEDDSYYLLDELSKPNRIRLYRIGLGWAPQLLAEWPRIGTFKTLDLTSGMDGALVLSGSNSGAHVIAVLREAAGALQLEALFFGPDPIAIPAFSSYDRITYVARKKDGTLEPREQPMRATGNKDKLGALVLDELKDAL